MYQYFPTRRGTEDPAWMLVKAEITFHYPDKRDNRLSLPDVHTFTCMAGQVTTTGQLFALLNNRRVGWEMNGEYGMHLPDDVEEINIYSDKDKVMLRTNPIVFDETIATTVGNNVEIWNQSDIEKWVREGLMEKALNIEVTMKRKKLDDSFKQL